MRTIALSQAWRDQGGKVLFLSAQIPEFLQERVRKEGFALQTIIAESGSREDLKATCAAIARYGGDSISVALDGYQFDAEFQLGLKKAGGRLLVIDDYGHADFYYADWVLNQNISASKELYIRRAPHTRLLLGTKFALLRQEFLKYRGWQRQIPGIARKMLVTLGGADPENVTRKVIEALAPLDIKVKVVVGGSNPNLRDLHQAIERMKTRAVKIELVINPEDMPGLMAWADLAIAAGGSTAWELAFMGLPSLFVILAENQVRIATELESAGFGVCLGKNINSLEDNFAKTVFFQASNIKFLQAASSFGTKMVDGLGAYRICELL